MADGRTNKKYVRAYVGGYDLSGDVTQAGPLAWTFPTDDATGLSDGAENRTLGTPDISPGSINTWFDNTAGRSFETLKTVQAQIVTVAIGIRAVPAMGDPVFSGTFEQNVFTAEGSGSIPVTAQFGVKSPQGIEIGYDKPWGSMLHPDGAETAVNGSTGLDGGAATAAGGYGFLHLLAGDGTCTFSIEHAAANVDATFTSTGDIITFATTDASAPFAEIKGTATATTSILQFTRWQIALGTATSVTFVMGLIRGR